MKSGNGFLIVQYDSGHMRDYDLGGIKIEISREVNMKAKGKRSIAAKVTGWRRLAGHGARCGN